jgi:cytochrome P450
LRTVHNKSFDWVETIGRRLPAQIILRGLNFNEADSEFVISNLATLVRIMSPNKTEEDIRLINPVVNCFYEITEKYIIASGFANGNNQATELMICNLIGLFIQCYDAGQGLISNTFLSLVANRGLPRQANDPGFYEKLVTETLRWDPPVHNTRRIAVKDIRLNGQTIRTGETILIVLAAANLDPIQFKDPEEFDINRNNNDQHLTFGMGGHNCIAKYLCINLAAQTCSFLMNNYKTISVNQTEFYYEPALNVRLMKELMIILT